MCVSGLVIFVNFSAEDFLTPGFNEKGIILQNVEIQGGSSVNGIIHVNEINKQYVVILSNDGSTSKFDVKIENSQWGVIHNTIFEKGVIRFNPDIKGDYQISIKNQSGKPTSVSISYGTYHDDYTQTSLTITALWALLIIGGSYLILHRYFIKMNTWFKPNYLNGINDDL